MAEQVGAIEIGVRVADERARQQFREIEAQAKRTADVVGNQRATMEIDGDLEPLRVAAKNARAELRRLEGEKADVELGLRKGDLAKLKDDIAVAKREVKSFDGELAEAELHVNVNLSELKEARAQMMLADREARRISAQRVKEAKIRADHQRQVTVGVYEEQLEVAKLQKRYADLTKSLERPRKAFTFSEHMRVKVDQDRALAEMAVLKAKLTAMGAAPPVGIKVRVDSSAEQAASKVFQALKNLSNTTLRIGPFTMSIKQFGVALGLLGPIITDVVGGLTALVGVLGTGITGAALVGGAGLAGMVLQFGGVFAVVKPLVNEYKALSTVSKAYDRAVMQYGRNSKQAEAAQKKLNTALSQADPAVRSAIKSMSVARQEWHKLTDETAKRNFGTILKSSAQTAQSVLPIIARNTNDTMNIIGHGVDSIMKRLRSQGGKSGLDQLGKNFNAGLAPALSGLEHFGAAIGKIMVSASRLLAPLGNAFNTWAMGLDQATSNTQRLDGTIDRLGKHAADLGHFFTSLGRLLATVLNGGADAGDNLLNSMTKTMNAWNRLLKTPEGQQSMKKFFDDAISGTKGFWNAISPLIAMFAKWSQIFGPFAAGAMKVVEILGKIGDAFLNITGGAGGAKGMATTIGSIFAVGKIAAFVGKLGEAALLMRQMSAASAFKFAFGGNLARGIVTSSAEGSAFYARAILSASAEGAAMMRAGVATGGGVAAGENFAEDLAAARMARRGGGVARAATGEAENLAKTGAAAAGAGRGMGLLARGGVAAATALGLEGVAGAATIASGGIAILGAGAIYGGYKLLTMKSASEKLSAKLKENVRDTNDMHTSNQQLSGSIQQAAYAQNDYKKSIDTVVAYKKQLMKLDAEGKAGTDAYKAVQQNLNAALDQRASSEQNVAAAEKQADAARDKSQKLLHQRVDATNVLNKANDEVAKKQKEYDRVMADGMSTPYQRAKAERDLTDAKKQQADAERLLQSAQRESERTNNILASGILAHKRAMAGLPALTDNAAAALGRLIRMSAGGKKIAQAINVDTTYSDPKDAEKVANLSARAVTKHVKQKYILDIIAKSDSAEATIRAFRAILKRNVPAKTVAEVLTKTKGEAQIVAMNALLGKIPRSRVAKVLADAGVAKGVIASILKALDGVDRKRPKPRVSVQDAASGVLRTISNLLGSLDGRHVKSVVETNHLSTYTKGKGRPDATGRGPGNSYLALVGEGLSGTGAHEIIADRKTGSMSVVDKPTMMHLSPDQYVIPTEPAYKDKGAKLMSMFAKDMGIPGYAGGRVATAKWGGTTIFGDKISKPGRDPENLDAVKAYWALTKKEDQVNRKISSASNAVKEPENLVSGSGTKEDPFVPNESAIQSYKNAQKPVVDGYAELIGADGNGGIVAQLQTAFTAAMNALGTYITNRMNNITALQKVRSHDEDIMNHTKIPAEYTGKNKDVKARNKTERDKAKKRIARAKHWYQESGDMIASEDGKRGKAEDEKTKLNDDNYDLTYRKQDYQTSLDAVNQQIADISTRAKEDVTSANESPPAISTAQAAAEALATQDALASIGQGTASTTDQKIAAQQAIIDAATPLLSDATSANDSAANSAIQGAAGAIQSLREGGGGSSDGANSAVTDQLNAANALAAKNSQINAAALQTFSGKGDIGSGGQNAYWAAAAGGNNITINTLHPADPATLRAIGNASSAGFNYQNGVTTSRGQVG